MQTFLTRKPILYFRDTVLWLSELPTQKDGLTQMVVLSFCETGIGKHAGGEEPFNLARRLMAVGVPSIVNTLWRTDNQTTFQLTESFYKYLSRGLHKDEALQQAKLDFLKANERYLQLPYFWASCILSGSSDKLEINSDPNTPIFYIVSGILLILVMLFVVHYKRKKLQVRKAKDNIKPKNPVCNFNAVIEAEVLLKQAVTVVVTISQDIMETETRKIPVKIPEEIKGLEKILIEVIPKSNFIAIEDIKTYQEIDAPQPNESKELFFYLRAIDEGEGEILIVARQGQVPIVHLKLKPKVIKTKTQSVRSL